MKKLITLSAILALSVATVAEAKGGRSGGFRSVSASKSVATKPATTQQKSTTNQTQQDATFANTPNTATQTQARTATGGNTMANVAMGAAAGYILGDMMSSTAHANQADTSATPTTETTQAVNSAQNIANGAVAEFKSIGGQIDPFLVEKTDGYRRYCIAGVQYLASAQGSQSSPIVMVNPNGSPLQCNLIP